MKTFLLLILAIMTVASGSCLAAKSIEPTGVYYRYINDDGITVLERSIPPKYATKGYEILSASLQIIKKVNPAKSADEIAQSKNENEILARYKILKRRYSRAEAIEGAKERKLAGIATNLAVLRGNINSLENKKRGITREAAQKERETGKVPKHLLKQLEDIDAEIKVAEKVLSIRLNEYDKEVERYDRDITNFKHGEEIQKRLNAELYIQDAGN